MDGIKKDLDGMFTSIRKITDVISLLQQEQAQALASTRNLLCLSCGRGDTNFPPTSGQVRGGDGKIYRSDNFSKGMNSVGQKDDPFNYGYEVFDRLEAVREHNMNLHEPTDNFMASENQKKNRPTSGITNLRLYRGPPTEEGDGFKGKSSPGKDQMRQSQGDGIKSQNIEIIPSNGKK